MNFLTNCIAVGFKVTATIAILYLVGYLFNTAYKALIRLMDKEQ